MNAVNDPRATNDDDNDDNDDNTDNVDNDDDDDNNDDDDVDEHGHEHSMWREVGHNAKVM